MPAHRMSGFSLLEILVVLTILALLTGTVMLSFTGAESEQALKGAAERMATRIELARQHSLTRNREWGIYVDEAEYRFAEFDPEQRTWIEMIQRPFNETDLPDLVSLSLDLEEYDNLPFAEEDELPQILIFSSGEITPFTLLLEPQWETYPWSVSSDGLARVQATRTENRF